MHHQNIHLTHKKSNLNSLMNSVTNTGSSDPRMNSNIQGNVAFSASGGSEMNTGTQNAINPFANNTGAYNKSFSLKINSTQASGPSSIVSKITNSTKNSQRPQYHSTLQHQTSQSQLHQLKTPSKKRSHRKFDKMAIDNSPPRLNSEFDSEYDEQDYEMDKLMPPMNSYSNSRVSPVLYSNPEIKYPRYTKLDSKLAVSASGTSVSSAYSSPTSASHTSFNSPITTPIDATSDSSSIRLPSIDSMSFQPQNQRHQSVLSTESSCFSTHATPYGAASLKRASYITTSSLQTSIDGLSLNQKDLNGITSIPEYGDLIEPSRFDRPLPLPPNVGQMYQNNNGSSQLSENASNHSSSVYYDTLSHTDSHAGSHTGSHNSAFAFSHKSSFQQMNSSFTLQQLKPPVSALGVSSPPQKPFFDSNSSHHSTTSHSTNQDDDAGLEQDSAEQPSGSMANYTSTIKFNSAPEEERKYQCKTCGRKFKTSGHVSRHSRIHTGERKHVCPFPGCGARFARHDNCMQHYKTHSNLNGKTAERMRNLKLKEQLSTKKMKIKALIW